MTGRLSTIITRIKELAYRYTAIRCACYLAILLALLLYWLRYGGGEISFVYNNF